MEEMIFNLCINMSNINIPVYERPSWSSRGNQIGTLFPREAFSVGEMEFGLAVYFRNSSGILTRGNCFYNNEAGDVVIDDADWRKAFSFCTDYPYDIATINGEKFYTFMFRRYENIYTPSGVLWGSVAAGMEVACRSAVMGETHWDWKGINYVKSSKTGGWIQVTDASYYYGFVNVGLNQGSMPNSISMYGSW